MTTVTYVEARRQINAMQRAKDAFGKSRKDVDKLWADIFGSPFRA